MNFVDNLLQDFVENKLNFLNFMLLTEVRYLIEIRNVNSY